MINDHKIDLHNGSRRLELATKRLEGSDIDKENKQYIKTFVGFIQAKKDISEGRRTKLYDELRKIAKKLGKPFNKATKSDIIDLVNWINGNGFAPATRKDYRQHLKRIIKWIWIEEGKIEDNGTAPPIVSWVTGEIKKEYNRNTLTAELILTEQEVLKMIKSEKELHWRAFTWLLWETGARVGEILNLRVRDVQPEDYGLMLNIKHGKTGARKMPLVICKQTLLNYIDISEKQPDDLLFSFTYSTVKAHMTMLGLRNGIIQITQNGYTGKNCSTKWWRKARASYLATKMNAPQLQYWFGWNKLETAQAYIRLSPEVVKDTYFKMNGINVSADMLPKPTTKRCHKCGQLNDLDKDFCLNCGHKQYLMQNN